MHERRTLSALSRKGTFGQRLPKSPRELKETKNTQKIKPFDPPLELLLSDQNPQPPDIEPLSPAPNSLMIMQAKIAGITARILIDSGTEVNHISLGFCQRHKIATKNENATATMANGSTEKLRTTKYP